MKNINNNYITISHINQHTKYKINNYIKYNNIKALKYSI